MPNNRYLNCYIKFIKFTWICIKNHKGWQYGKDFAFVLNVHDEYQAEVKPELVDEYKIMAVEAIRKELLKDMQEQNKQ